MPKQLAVELSDRIYPCEIVSSSRARYLRIKLEHSGRLSVVVPKGVKLADVKRFIESQTPWIERHVSKLPPDARESSLPEYLMLNYLSEHWVVEYCADASSGEIELYTKEPNRLICHGPIDNHELVRKTLGGWLKQKAEAVLPSRLCELAEQHGFHFNRVTIRGQKTRWGSCSHKKNINLNYKLLFLEPNIVDYVLIHELCHTIELNHSKRFWDLVADCDQNYRQHDKQLNPLAKTIPL